ncbi:hypothetical protein K2173_028147 [Erythroxylum novogranatense]|uniref:Transmembrane protein n=1 Tax=Erythroxylum novogranatense TaxID=1862640 RepID=A0AAV8U3M8_9ROSI|nr:hypothetical protein K2173_028147 [Erythroxylum novogranatense]
MVEDDISLAGLNGLEDSSNDTNAHNDFSVFPPINHENLIPSKFDADPDAKSLLLSSKLTHVKASPPDTDPAPPTATVPTTPRWGRVALEVLRSKVVNFVLYVLRYNVGGGRECGNGRAIKLVGNAAFAAAMAVAWWLLLRIRRRWRKRDRVVQLLRIVEKKDEKIIQLLLNKIVQMNDVLLSRRKALPSKLAD